MADPTSPSSTDSATQVTARSSGANGTVEMAPAADAPEQQFQIGQSELITDDRTNADIFETTISEEVYEQNYQYGTDTHVPDTWYRNARYLASVEDDGILGSGVLQAP